MGENSENVHGVEARMKKSMFRQVPKPLKIKENLDKKYEILRAGFEVDFSSFWDGFLEANGVQNRRKIE